MAIIFLILVAIALAAFGFFIYRSIAANKLHQKLNEQRFERIKPLWDKLENGIAIQPEEVIPFAENILTREVTYHFLEEYKKADLFPSSYYTIIQGAESNLCNWLEYPTELGACPDEIEHVEKVTFKKDGVDIYYHVFKFRVNEPHWAAKDGWMLGVVGPYFDDSKPYDFPGSTFSRLSSKFGEIDPKEEAKWVHEQIAKIAMEED